MKQEWLNHCLRLSKRKADMYSGCRKIMFGVKLTFMDLWDDEDPLVLEDAGYTSAKMSHLKRLYVHPESIEAAVKLWNLRRTKTSYGSVGFTCYNHFVKNDAVNKSKRASVMGPCLTGVIITQLKGGGKAQYRVDVMYRTTELFKKFTADLVFIRDILLNDFNFEGMEFMGMTCHFANMTLHPQYLVTVLPELKDPIVELEKIKAKDSYYHEWCIKWTARYICEEHYRGIAKFAQALRVKMDADKRITGKKRRILAEYLRANHPGHRHPYEAPDGEDE